jgi:uncharacterized protein (TIGR03546 family)
MIFWTIKQILSLKKAVTGRAQPSELAWGLALGIAIGLVPKGNLVALGLIGLLISLRVNHGMAALSAVVVSFLAVKFDPWTHELGFNILSSPQVRTTLERWWDAPLVPWTDLNNTVVMGSTVVGLVSIVPTFLLTLPIFRWLAPRINDDAQQTDPPPAAALTLSQPQVSEPRSAAPLHVFQEPLAASGATSTKAPANKSSAEATVNQTHIETQIEIIRIAPATSETSIDDRDAESDDKHGPMNEALGYLLRRLRDSRTGKAA